MVDERLGYRCLSIKIGSKPLVSFFHTQITLVTSNFLSYSGHVFSGALQFSALTCFHVLPEITSRAA